jgi:hypothetical protein
MYEICVPRPGMPVTCPSYMTPCAVPCQVNEFNQCPQHASKTHNTHTHTSLINLQILVPDTVHKTHIQISAVTLAG